MIRGMTSFKELFDFSLRSEESANFIREFSAFLNPRIHVTISKLSEDKFKFSLGRGKCLLGEAGFNMILASSQEAKKLLEKHPEKIETIVVNNVEYGFYFPGEYLDYSVIVPEDIRKDGMALLEHFKDIFSAELKELRIAPGAVSIASSSKNLIVKEGKVSHLEMSKYLEEESEEKILECTPEPSGFSYNHPILVDRLVIQNSQWFSRQNLLNLDCSRISLGRSTLTSEDLNEFIKKWLISDNKKFQQLIVSEALSEHQMLNLDVISSGLDTMPICKKRKTEDFGFLKLMKQKPISEFDIRRDDGVIATVTLSKSEFGNEEFQFEVQNPKKKKSSVFRYYDLDSDEGESFSHHLLGSSRTHAEIRNLLEKSEKTVNIYQNVEPGFVYHEPISVDNLSMNYSNWFTRQNLLSLDCKKVHLGKTKLTNEDINAFISQWYHSDNKKLERLSIWGFGTDKKARFEPNLAIITAGIPTVKGKNRKGSLKRTLFERKKYEKGLDIIRSDGLEANVLIHKNEFFEERDVELIFTVWHPKEKKKAADKATDKDSNQEDLEKASDEVVVDDFEML